MFQNRLRIVADYYNKVTDNMIFSITLPDTSAYSSVKANVGSARFSGFELEVHSINVQKKNFTWTTDLTYTYNRNRVLSLPDEYKYTDVDGRDAWRIGGYIDDRERLPLRRHGRGRTTGTHLRLQDRGHHPVAGRRPTRRSTTASRTATAVRTASRRIPIRNTRGARTSATTSGATARVRRAWPTGASRSRRRICSISAR